MTALDILLSHLLLGGLLPLDGTIPDPAPEAPPGFADPVSNIIAAAKWGGLVVLVLGILITAATIWTDSHRGTNYMSKFGLILVGVILISGAVGLVGWVMG